MKIPDEMLSAYVNGELDGSERRRIEQAIAHDRRIAQRVARQRARRARWSTALDEMLSQTQRLRRDPGRLYPGPAEIIDLAQVRAQRSQQGRRRQTPRPSALMIATGLLAAMALGCLLTWLGTPTSMMQYQKGMLLARGVLERALNEQIAGQGPAASSIRIGATYRMRTGAYCRAFSIAGAQALTGLACRERARWQVQTLQSGAAAQNLLLEMNRTLNAAPLGSAAEIQLRARQWQ